MQSEQRTPRLLVDKYGLRAFTVALKIRVSRTATSSIALAIVAVPPHFCSPLPDRQEAGIFDV
jgi:hypothetical protein